VQRTENAERGGGGDRLTGRVDGVCRATLVRRAIVAHRRRQSQVGRRRETDLYTSPHDDPVSRSPPLAQHPLANQSTYSPAFKTEKREH